MLYVEESSLIKTCLAEAQAWMSKVADLMPILRTSLIFSEESDLLHIHGAESWRVFLPQLEVQMTKLKSVLDEGLEFRLDLPGIAELQALFTVNEWSIRALRLLEDRPQLEVILVQRPALLRMWQVYYVIVSYSIFIQTFILVPVILYVYIVVSILNKILSAK